MKKWLGWILFAIVVITAVNDGGRFLAATYKLDDVSRTILLEARAVAAKDASANSAWPTVQRLAQDNGLEAIGFEQTSQGIAVALRVQVTGTWAVGPAYAYLTKQPLSTPYPLERTVRATP